MKVSNLFYLLDMRSSQRRHYYSENGLVCNENYVMTAGGGGGGDDGGSGSFTALFNLLDLPVEQAKQEVAAVYG